MRQNIIYRKRIFVKFRKPIARPSPQESAPKTTDRAKRGLLFSKLIFSPNPIFNPRTYGLVSAEKVFIAKNDVSQQSEKCRWIIEFLLSKTRI